MNNTTAINHSNRRKTYKRTKHTAILGTGQKWDANEEEGGQSSLRRERKHEKRPTQDKERAEEKKTCMFSLFLSRALHLPRIEKNSFVLASPVFFSPPIPPFNKFL